MYTANTPAKLIVRYFEAYKQYIQDNGLSNDCNSITVGELVNFVETTMSREDRELYLKRISN